MLSRSFKQLFRIPKRTFVLQELMTPDGIPNELKNNTSRNGLITYNKGELEFKPYLVLKSKQNIEEYVVSLIQNYFRTTYKSGLTVESSLADHGLDSLDVVELCMQIEEDLGYDIATETLPNFQSVNHFVNYIGQVEGFKETYSKEPLA